MKICSKCNESKDEALFDNQTKAKDGKKPFCKTCSKKLNQARYQRLQPKILEQVLAWQAKNPEKVAEAKAKYRNKTS